MSPPSAAPSVWASGDARSNLAVQPAANLGSIKLKKKAVKMVGAAGPVSGTTSRPAALTLPMASSSNAGPAKVELKVSDGPTVAPKSSSVEKSIVASSAATPTETAAPQKEDPNPTSDAFEESAMDALYARLNSKTVLTPRNPIGSTSVRPEQAKFSFGDRLAESKADNTKIDKAEAEKAEHKGIDGIKVADVSQEELENAYMRKASDYIQAIPDVNGNTASLIKAMSRKLRGSYMPEVKTDVEKNEIIKARLAFAVANYINKVLKKRPEQPRTPESIKQTLKDANGDFLRLCAKLVEEGHLSLETLAEVSGIVAAMHNILPKPELPATASVIAPTKAAPPVASSTENTKPVSKDPADGMKGWPTQEKRENRITSINQLQALVWGGKLESISLPEPGSSNALVKFLTPEACEKYHKATANGIEIVGDIKKAVVFVEKAEGPNSINDVIRNCIDGDASRCVRAIGADEDSDAVLMKLARGKGVNKRDVDRIKSGKTARGHSYVEFRFSNIYHALNFKRELMDNDDWEHCSIGYAPDPCELANGAHYKDKDEE
ncbi:hypothetical protein J4E82_000756 [Alternaria postmessia]|uniref:uncharacterized protein n=1 Tax=Alternaria postmessia TaxID=1187938 RepID=UPI002223F7B6|nr:uncharacterized protein J4E82_000756 [Alternaria postmessia]KAI5380798.1 hypothetical protein J4E82_000756 [Alternaria postmessia]